MFNSTDEATLHHKPSRMVLESQTTEFVCVCVCVCFHKCGCLCCKGLIKKKFVDLELARDRVSKFYMW